MNASDRQQLLQALKPLVTQLEDDLRERVDDDAQLTADLTEQWTQLKAKGRTAESFLEWREAYLTQGAVAWVLTCVFVRYLEDNELLRQAFISGVGDTYDQSDDQRRAYADVLEERGHSVPRRGEGADGAAQAAQPQWWRRRKQQQRRRCRQQQQQQQWHGQERGQRPRRSDLIGRDSQSVAGGRSEAHPVQQVPRPRSES